MSVYTAVLFSLSVFRTSPPLLLQLVDCETAAAAAAFLRVNVATVHAVAVMPSSERYSAGACPVAPRCDEIRSLARPTDRPTGRHFCAGGRRYDRIVARDGCSDEQSRALNADWRQIRRPTQLSGRRWPTIDSTYND